MPLMKSGCENKNSQPDFIKDAADQMAKKLSQDIDNAVMAAVLVVVLNITPMEFEIKLY